MINILPPPPPPPPSLLLYLSLFGFTMEPRVYRARYQPPRGFMDDTEGRKTPRRLFLSLPLFSPTAPQTLGPMAFLAGHHKTGVATHRSNVERQQHGSNSSEQQATLSEEQLEFIAKAREMQNIELKYSWEYSLLLQCRPEEVRREVDVLISDLIVRLKQLLFNSLFCAYYVGFIPMQFADVSVWEWD